MKCGLRMTILAAALKGEEIVPIVEGDWVRIYNTETNGFEDHRNPALSVEEGRRGEVLKFVNNFNVTVFLAPPNTFCERSYDKAKEQDIQFVQLNPGTLFQQFLESSYQFSTELPQKEIVPS